MDERRAHHNVSSGSGNKKRKHGHEGQSNEYNKRSQGDFKKARRETVSYDDAVEQLPPRTSECGPVPAYVPFSIPSTSLPPLPEVKQGSLSTAPFRHRSSSNYRRSTAGATSATEDLSYERLELLGDAYIEVIATRLIFERYAHLPAGQQSQLRELLVKNETLGEYSKAYGFDRRVDAGGMAQMIQDGKQKGNKGFNKVLGDVFEAYVAAVILSDAGDGFAVAEKWLTTLWAPKLVKASVSDASYAASQSLFTGADKVYDPTAKQELQKRVLGDQSTRLSYEPYKETVELKGDQLGQNRHFIALYLTGYGYERKLLGKGEGKNKVEAGNWAATQAMHGECKSIVEECERKLQEGRAERAAQKSLEKESE